MRHFESEIVAGPRCEEFLQAQIGVNKTGMPISVRTALARQGLDPDGEADRLARLPRAQARRTLAAFIHTIVEGTWHESEVRGKAESLARLLPPPATGAVRPENTASRWWWLILMVLLIVALLLVVMSTDWTGSWLASLH
jgi:hypothetical protein